MDSPNLALQSYIDNPIVSTELLAHAGGGYRKSLTANTNVITKEVNFTVLDRFRKTTSNYSDLLTAIDAYEKIKKFN